MNFTRHILRMHLLVLITLIAVADAKTKMSVIISMIGPQLEYFKKQCAVFERLEKIQIDIVNTDQMDELGKVLSSQNNVGLFMIPFGSGWSLVKEHRVKPLNQFLTAGELNNFCGEYILTWLGKKNGLQYFLPHKYETRIMVYRKSKVQNALEIWKNDINTTHVLRNSIDEKLKEINGYGLPAGYTLESDPGKWDFYDIFVIGTIWAQTPDNGVTSPRIGHRGKKYSGTALRVIDRVIQCGGDTTDVMSMSGPQFEDAFRWEVIYNNYGIYTPRMWKEQWSGQDLWKQFGNGSIYLGYLTQLDCFFLHGTENPDMEGFMADPSELGFALMPQGCSVALNSDTTLVRPGTHAVTNGGWWWGIPSTWTMPNLSYKFFLYLTTRKQQEEQCLAFGLIPVRSDIVKDKKLLYESGWKSEVFSTSYEQIRINNNHVIPSNPSFDRISNLYSDLLFDIVNQPHTQGDSSLIQQALFNQYFAKAAGVLKK